MAYNEFLSLKRKKCEFIKKSQIIIFTSHFSLAALSLLVATERKHYCGVIRRFY